MSQRFDLILKNTAKYILLNPEEADFFTSLLEYKSVKRKEYLLKEGDVCRYETFVIKGCLRNYSIDKNGVEHIGMFAMEDWWTGDLYSFMTKKPSVYNIEALKDTEVFQLSKESQEKLLPKFRNLKNVTVLNFKTPLSLFSKG